METWLPAPDLSVKETLPSSLTSTPIIVSAVTTEPELVEIC